jgi:hypothetical protein
MNQRGNSWTEVNISLVWESASEQYDALKVLSDRWKREVPWMTGVGGLILLLLAITSITPAIAALRVEDVLRVQTQLTQTSQASRQGAPLEDAQMVQPSPKERAVVSQMLTTKPRPKTLNDADVKYLNDLLHKAAWYGFERRIVHKMWTEVSGKEWHDTEVLQPPKNEKSP